MTELSAEPVAASPAKAPAPESAASAAASTATRGRGTRKTLGIALLSLWAFSDSREGVTCLRPVRNKSGPFAPPPLTSRDLRCSLERQRQGGARAQLLFSALRAAVSSLERRRARRRPCSRRPAARERRDRGRG